MATGKMATGKMEGPMLECEVEDEREIARKKRRSGI
jgi:hypothetical protein